MSLFFRVFCCGGHATLFYKARNKKEECCDSRQFGKYEMPPKKPSLSLYIIWGRRPRYPLRETMGGIVASEEEEGNFLCPTNNKTPKLFFGAHSCFPPKTQRTFIPFIFQGKNWRRRQQVFSPVRKKINSSSLFTRNRRRRRKIPSQ